jgi:hypothetical protein
MLDPVEKYGPERAIRAYLGMMARTLSDAEKARFKEEKTNCWDCISDVRKILTHDHPQNRSEDYPYFDKDRDPRIVVYKDASGRAAKEPRGLLSLSSKNDDTAPPVNKPALVNYIKNLIIERIKQQALKLLKIREMKDLEPRQLLLLAQATPRHFKYIAGSPELFNKLFLASEQPLQLIAKAHSESADYILLYPELRVMLLTKKNEMHHSDILWGLGLRGASTTRIILNDKYLRGRLLTDVCPDILSDLLTPENKLTQLAKAHPDKPDVHEACAAVLKEMRDERSTPPVANVYQHS